MSINLGTTRDVVKSDTPNDTFTMVMVTTTSGSVDFDQEGGNNIVLTAVPVGVWVPVGNATNINTATTAVGIMVF
jgi:hypothetical protein